MWRDGEGRMTTRWCYSLLNIEQVFFKRCQIVQAWALVKTPGKAAFDWQSRNHVMSTHIIQCQALISFE